jgi:glutamyl-tRNA synthetase
MTADILKGLRWLGLDWDEGPGVEGPHAPYFQSERLDRYRKTANWLVEQESAYRCFCTIESLQDKRAQAQNRGEGWRYDRTCLGLPTEHIAELEAAGTKHVIRFKVPEGRTVFDDAVRGRIEVAHETIEDLIIVRSDGQPTYHLSNVVDDIDMAITHVLRGEDHISNTPKHILLFRALGAEVPVFAHLPLILGSDKKRLSKRHGATSIAEYEQQGFLSDTMVNFLSLLGWSPGGNQELMSRAELLETFSLDGVSGGNAIFDSAKLEWMNGQHIARLPVTDLVVMVRPSLEAEALWPALGRDETWLWQLLELLQPRVKRLGDFVHQAQPFLTEKVNYEADAVSKHLLNSGVASHVESLLQALRDTLPFEKSKVETTLRSTADALDIKASALIHPTRVALTGRTAGPSLFETIALLGQECTLTRLEALLEFLVDPERI